MSTEKLFTFTVDDNIRFLRELSGNGERDLFRHPYPAMWRRLHERYGVKIQLNLFGEEGSFRLSQVPDSFRSAFAASADWLKLSFHARTEFPAHPYREADASVLLADNQEITREILRFAGERSHAATTTVHYCTCTAQGVEALRKAGVRGLLGLFGTPEAPRTSYRLSPEECDGLRRGVPLIRHGMLYANIQAILNQLTLEQIPMRIGELTGWNRVSLMIHEQYFYPDDRRYQPEFEEKVSVAVDILRGAGFQSSCLEEWL